MNTKIVCPYCGASSFDIWQPCLLSDYRVVDGEIKSKRKRGLKTHNISALRYECVQCSRIWVDEGRKTVNEMVVGKLDETLVGTYLGVEDF